MPKKHFLIFINYKVPIETVEKNTPDHRGYLKTLYDKDLLLCSGPMVPRTGGLLWAYAEDRQAIDDLIANDPFHIRGVAEYEVKEFNPVMHSENLLTHLSQK